MRGEERAGSRWQSVALVCSFSKIHVGLEARSLHVRYREKKSHERKTPVMKIEITLFDQAEENPTGDVVEVVQTESGFLSAETVRGIVQSKAGHLVVQEVSIALLEQPWFWSAALAAQADVLELVLVEGESLGQVEETLKRVSWAAQEVVSGASVGLA